MNDEYLEIRDRYPREFALMANAHALEEGCRSIVEKMTSKGDCGRVQLFSLRISATRLAQQCSVAELPYSSWAEAEMDRRLSSSAVVRAMRRPNRSADKKSPG